MTSLADQLLSLPHHQRPLQRRKDFSPRTEYRASPFFYSIQISHCRLGLSCCKLPHTVVRPHLLGWGWGVLWPSVQTKCGPRGQHEASSFNPDGDGPYVSLPQDMCLQSPLQSKKLLTMLKLVDKPRSVIRNINDTIQVLHRWTVVDYYGPLWIIWLKKRRRESWLLLDKLLPDVDFNKHHTAVPLPKGAVNFLRQQNNQLSGNCPTVSSFLVSLALDACPQSARQTPGASLPYVIF